MLLRTFARAVSWPASESRGSRHATVSMIPAPLERLVTCALVECLQVEHLSVRLTTYISIDTQTPRQAVQMFTLARGFVKRRSARLFESLAARLQARHLVGQTCPRTTHGATSWVCNL